MPEIVYMDMITHDQITDQYMLEIIFGHENNAQVVKNE